MDSQFPEAAQRPQPPFRIDERGNRSVGRNSGLLFADSSLRTAARDGIVEFWLDLTAGKDTEPSSNFDPLATADVLAKSMLSLFQAEDLLLNPNDVSRYSDADVTQALRGDETVSVLARFFAGRARIEESRSIQGFRGGITTVRQEVLRYAERYQNDPDMILALLKGMLPLTVRNNRHLGRSAVDVCALIACVLMLAENLIDFELEHIQIFLEELMHFVVIGLRNENSFGSYKSAEQILEFVAIVIEHSPTKERLRFLSICVWHEILKVHLGSRTAAETDQHWLDIYIQILTGYARILSRVSTTNNESAFQRLRCYVERLSNFAAIASILRFQSESPSGGSFLTMAAWLNNPPVMEEVLTPEGVRPPLYYAQFMSAIHAHFPIWELETGKSTNEVEMFRELFFRGTIAVTSLEATSIVERQIDCWSSLAECIRQNRIHIIEPADFSNGPIFEVEEVLIWLFVQSLLLQSLSSALESGVAAMTLESPYILNMAYFVLERIWSCIHHLLVERVGDKGYDPRNPPSALDAAVNFSFKLLSILPENGSRATRRRKLIYQQILAVASRQPHDVKTFSDRTAVRKEFAKAYTGIMTSLSRSRGIPDCPEFGGEIMRFHEQLAGGWHNSLLTLTTSVNRTLPLLESGLQRELLVSIARLRHQAMSKTIRFSDVFFSQNRIEQIPSILAQKTPTEESRAWNTSGPIINHGNLTEFEWEKEGVKGQLGDIASWLEANDFMFLGDSPRNTR